jgi:hypothetical protein
MSIYINNFFMDDGDIIDCNSLIDFSVDVTDPVYNITTSGTYFINNGVKVPTVFSTISGGYTLTYSTTPSGNMYLELIAQNSNNDVVANIYEFNFGYEVSWNEVVNWGTDKQVPIAINTTNNTLAPNTSYFTTFFHTHKEYAANLAVEITAEGSGFIDLPVLIKPQSKYFIYGNTYSVTVSGIKDFGGNVLDVIKFTFKIEEE